MFGEKTRLSKELPQVSKSQEDEPTAVCLGKMDKDSAKLRF